MEKPMYACLSLEQDPSRQSRELHLWATTGASDSSKKLLTEEDIITKVDLQERLVKVNEQIELRLQPIKLQMQSLKVHKINEDTIQEVMTNFYKAFKKAMTQEQQKHLVTLIIKEITLNQKREVDSIQIQFNNTVLDYLTEQGADKSLADDLSAPFLVIINL